MKNSNVLTTEERLSLTLSELYGRRGYSRYRMSKFEEYGLYLENKSFLRGEKIIAFNDTDGKLLALKPDVTLSIVKSAGETFGGVKKLYYNESVYRIDKSTAKFREISQMGLEAIGNLDDYTMFEVVTLALKSLNEIDKNYVLDLANVGFITGFLDTLDTDGEGKERLISCIASKNLDELLRLSEEFNFNCETKRILKKTITVNGDFERALAVARSIAVNEKMVAAADDLARLYEALKSAGLSKKVRLDFSIINDIDYYNDIVFRGYVKKVPRAVLAGGRYDKLIKKFDESAEAVGFAVYLNEVASYYTQTAENDVDVVILYDKTADTNKLYNAVSALTDKGLAVSVAVSPPENVRYDRLIRFDGVKLSEVENA